jgi:hypothetical protein
MTPSRCSEETEMIGNVSRVITTCVIALGVGSSTTLAQTGVRFGHNAPPVPANIEVPAGYSVFFKAHAIGTQNYVCLPAASGVAWKFMAPQATLFHASHGEISQQLATHFLSANTAENGLPRPTWQHSLDSSRAVSRAPMRRGTRFRKATVPRECWRRASTPDGVPSCAPTSRRSTRLTPPRPASAYRVSTG